jgi:hypothetical protein
MTKNNLISMLVNNDAIDGKFTEVYLNRSGFSHYSPHAFVVKLNIKHNSKWVYLSCIFKGCYFIKLDFNTIPSEIYTFSDSIRDDIYDLWIKKVKNADDWQYYVLEFDVESKIHILCKDLEIVPINLEKKEI